MTLEKACQEILAKHMGPAAQIFLTRQCRRFLQKEPAKLEKTDFEALANCCFTSAQPILGLGASENIRKSILELGKEPQIAVETI